jgi:hypothetical protein
MAFTRKYTAADAEVSRRIASLADELVAELGELDASQGTCWFDAIEREAVAIGDAVSRALMARRAQERPADDREAICPECGRAGRSQGDRERELITRRGPTTIREPQYFCPCCRKDFFPADPRAGRGAGMPV